MSDAERGGKEEMFHLVRFKRLARGLALMIPALLIAPSASWAAGGAADSWLAGFNIGSGALVLNPVVIVVQWANFLVLLFILNKILVRPLMGLMESRDAEISGDRRAAERGRSETAGYVSQYEDSLAEIEGENTEALIALQQEMSEASRERIDEMRERTNREIEETRQSLAEQTKWVASELEGRAVHLASEIASRLAGRAIG